MGRADFDLRRRLSNKVEVYFRMQRVFQGSTTLKKTKLLDNTR